jgi:hypothetical protein
LGLKRKNPQFPFLLSNFPRFLGFWEVPYENVSFQYAIEFSYIWEVSLDLATLGGHSPGRHSANALGFVLIGFLLTTVRTVSKKQETRRTKQRQQELNSSETRCN